VQVQGFAQVNIAVTEMDKVTQQNAATAEEAASASEELNAQTEEMKSFVYELSEMVGGNETVSPDSSHTTRRPKDAGYARQASPKALDGVKNATRGKALAYLPIQKGTTR
jgi:methyl-accepting chemotaxis protein